MDTQARTTQSLTSLTVTLPEVYWFAITASLETITQMGMLNERTKDLTGVDLTKITADLREAVLGSVEN